MVNPGAFRGSRNEFLTSEKAVYAAGVDGGYAADALADIQRRYFKRYPIDLPHDTEPSAEFLAAVDDSAADPEQPPPDDSLSTEEYAKEMKSRQQIRRWLTYQYMKDRDSNSKTSGSDDPYSMLLSQLTGASAKKPRSKLPVNLWRRTQREAIETEVRRRIQQTATDEGRLNLGSEHRKMAGVREKIVREWFGALSQEEKDGWAVRAKEDYEKMLVEWKNLRDNGPSAKPADQQRCIENLVRFAQPILDGICQATGWKTSLIAGGPEPAHGGRLNIISIHSGTTSGDVKVNFGRSEHMRYKKFFVPMYADFLRKCYTPEQCRACALPDDEFEGLYTMGLEEDDVNFDSVDVPDLHGLGSSNVSSSTPHPIDYVAPRLPDRTNASEKTVVASIRSSPPDVTTAPPDSSNSQPLAAADTSIPATSSTEQTRALESQPSALAGVKPTPPAIVDVPSALPEHPVEPSEAQLSALLDVFAPDPASRSPSTDPWDIPMPHPLSCPPSVALSPNPSPRATPSPGNASKRASSPVPDQPSKRPRVVRAEKEASRPKTAPATRRKAKVTVPKSKKPPISVSTSTPPPPSVSNVTDAFVVPEDSPAWFSSAIAMFSAPDLGVEWKALLRKWQAFEMRSDFADTSALKATGRPEAVGMWIGRKRAITWYPKLAGAKAVKSYGTSHIKWWDSLVANTKGDWELLRKSGVNGLLSAIASLFFWGIHVKRSSQEGARWLSSVANCTDCLAHFT